MLQLQCESRSVGLAPPSPSPSGPRCRPLQAPFVPLMGAFMEAASIVILPPRTGARFEDLVDLHTARRAAAGRVRLRAEGLRLPRAGWPLHSHHSACFGSCRAMRFNTAARLRLHLPAVCLLARSSPAAVVCRRNHRGELALQKPAAYYTAHDNSSPLELQIPGLF